MKWSDLKEGNIYESIGDPSYIPLNIFYLISKSKDENTHYTKLLFLSKKGIEKFISNDAREFVCLN